MSRRPILIGLLCFSSGFGVVGARLTLQLSLGTSIGQRHLRSETLYQRETPSVYPHVLRPRETFHLLLLLLVIDAVKSLGCVFGLEAGSQDRPRKWLWLPTDGLSRT